VAFVIVLLIAAVLTRGFTDGLSVAGTIRVDLVPLYSLLAGAAAGLLGFLIAAITILSSFPRRSNLTGAEWEKERELRDARADTAKLLATTCALLLVALVSSGLLVMVEAASRLAIPAQAILLASCVGSTLGLAIGLLLITAAVIERMEKWNLVRRR
jgi:hypothetical protein